MKKYRGTVVLFLATVVLMGFMAGGGAWAANGLQIGGRALADVVPVDTLKSAISTALRHQTIDLVSKYLVQIADRAIRLEISTYDHLSVIYNLVIGMPDEIELISLAMQDDRLVITGIADSRQVADDFASHLCERGFSLFQADCADNATGQCVFYLELHILESGLSIP